MSALLEQFKVFARRYPLVVASVIVILLVGAAAYFQWQQAHEQAARLDEVRSKGESMLLSLTNQPRITAELATVQEALDFIDKNLIAEGDLAENLGYFYQIETRSRLRLAQVNQLSSQPQPDGSPFIAVPFALRASGTYRQLMGLLHELETGPRQLKITRYGFAHADDKADSLTLDLTCELLARP